MSRSYKKNSGTIARNPKRQVNRKYRRYIQNLLKTENWEKVELLTQEEVANIEIEKHPFKDEIVPK